MSRGNLDRALPKGKSKTDLSDRLWPIMRQRVLRAQKRQTEERIPAVEAMERARQMVLEVPAGKTALSLHERDVVED